MTSSRLLISMVFGGVCVLSSVVESAVTPRPLQSTTTSCQCGEAEKAAPILPGVVWTGSEPISLSEMAHLAAPALWFSRDEPLLNTDNPVFPEAHPCDRPSTEPVVYYQVTEIVYQEGEPVSRPEEDDPRFFEKVSNLILKYFFYYRRDFGLGGHAHDLEAVELDVFLEKEDGCYRVRIDTVTALAHGNRWYSNILEVREDTRFPVTIFVEEGKHGSAPDRNSDGHFTRGYDVNQRVNDAWGVRDIMGSGVLLNAAYNSDMTKPRDFEHRLLPPESSLLCVRPRNSSLNLSPDDMGRYGLRPGNRVPICEDVPEERGRLVSMMKYHGYGEEEHPRQHKSIDAKVALRELSSPNRWLSVSLRASGALGVGLVVKGLDLRQGWIVPKINVNSFAYSVGAMFTPSASRFLDYYLVGGIQRQFESLEISREIDTENGRQEITIVEPPQWNFYSEVGVKIRAEVPAKARPFVLGYHFGGVRLGVQALGLGRLDDIRLIFEIGAGAW